MASITKAGRGAGGFADLHRRMVAGEVASEEVVRSQLGEISRYNSKFNAFITVFEGESQPALDAARAADARLRKRGARQEPLIGVPFVIKDNFFFAGYRTTNACSAFEKFVPRASAALVDSLLASGMAPLGKTNMHELALGATSSSSFFGPVRNPWDAERVSGGSSGGTAVAVSLSKEPILGLGSDTGGSIRVPAALCGVCGFKPSLGSLSTEGIFPLGATLDHAGLMTKTMPDLVAAFSALGGREVGVNARTDRRRHRRLRMGIPEKHFGEGTDRRVSRVFWEAVDRLRAAGNFDLVEGAAFPDATWITAVRTTLQFREAAWFYDEIVRTEKLRQGMHPDVLGFLDRGSRIGMLRYMHANLARSEFIGEMNRIFRSFDLLMMPTCLIVAPKLDDVSGKEGGRIRPLLLRDTEPFNLCGFPALSCPATAPGDGLPVGIQIAGRYGEDVAVLRAGEELADALG